MNLNLVEQLAAPHAFRALDFPAAFRLRAFLATWPTEVRDLFRACPDCDGVGCDACRGVGWVPWELLEHCPACGGDDDICTRCNGTGYVRVESLDVQAKEKF